MRMNPSRGWLEVNINMRKINISMLKALYFQD